MILTIPNTSEKKRCYRFSLRNIVSKEKDGRFSTREPHPSWFVSRSNHPHEERPHDIARTFFMQFSR
jgi:hypothetical protein